MKRQKEFANEEFAHEFGIHLSVPEIDMKAKDMAKKRSQKDQKEEKSTKENKSS
ncbi:hypothetical protein GN156_01125 [bacterium LRH843]|nr:hypothetical protein [bacterium LRH843]